MDDSLREPRKHTKMYDELMLCIVVDDQRLKRVIGELNGLMRRYEMSLSEIQMVVRFVCEQQRWAEYAIRQGSTQVPKPKAKLPWVDDSDGEGEELDQS